MNHVTAPVNEAPINEGPIHEAPITKAAINKALVHEAAINKALTHEAPASEAPVEEAPIRAQAAAPVADPVTAPSTAHSEQTAPAKSPPVQPRLVDQSSGAAIWLEALKKLQENHPDKYKVLDKVIENVGTCKNDKFSKWFELSESKPESKALLQRAKAILPSVGTTRAVAMTIAGVDHHGIAPFVVAGSFFMIDVLLGRLGVEEQRKIRNMLFESVNAINEWISFETNLLKRNDAVEQNIQELEALLPNLYTLALQVLCNLLTASNASWLKSVGNKLSARIVEWQEQVEQLKDHRAKWTADRKVMEEKLTRLDRNAEVLKLIKNPDDPEQSLEALRDRVTSEGRHKDSASWILENRAFIAWSRKFYNLEPSMSITSDIVSKPILWISGPYGVGKTTIVHRIVSELQRLAEGYLPSGVREKKGSEAKGLQVISYFCDTSKRANYETIIRSIGQKLSILPNFNIAKAALKFYNDRLSRPTSKLYIKDYENLVHSLLKDSSGSNNIALIIDALNECDPPQDAERLFKFMRDIISENPHIRILFSSHKQISGSEQLKEHLEKVEVVLAAPEVELKDFVPVEIQFRQAKLKDSRSIFPAVNPDYHFLLDELQQSLIDRAKGMYIWVQIWLDITLPLIDSITVKLENEARKLLEALKNSSTGASEANEQLQAGYQQLWDLGALRYFDKIRIRLFRFVLCAFEPLDLRTITHALRIGIDDDEPLYRKEISIEDIDKLSSNFLSKDKSGSLVWNQDAARDFVVSVILSPGVDLVDASAQKTSMKRNHLLVANTFLAVMGVSDHPIWKEVSIDPSQWKETWTCLANRRVIEEARTSLGYLARCGWRHCQYATDEREIFDPLWTQVFEKVIIPPKTAFPLWWSAWYKYPGGENQQSPSEILGNYAGERVILISHVFASLNLKADSKLDVLLEKAAKISPERSLGENLVANLLKHAACESLNGANVFHLACHFDNGNVSNLMLQTILDRPGGVARVSELLEEEYGRQTPFVRACYNTAWYHAGETCCYDVMEVLLGFEHKYLIPNSGDQSSNRPLSSCLWSQLYYEQTALTLALETCQQDEVISLLKIHNPCNINIQNKDSKETALHCAANNGLFHLVKVLVELYHADDDLRDSEGRTPLALARDGLEYCFVSKNIKEEEIKEKLNFSMVIEYLESIKQSD